MTKGKTSGPPDFKATDVTVIHKESAGSIIVKAEDGSTESLATRLPEVERGNRGKVIEIDGVRAFIREPYGF